MWSRHRVLQDAYARRGEECENASNAVTPEDTQSSLRERIPTTHLAQEERNEKMQPVLCSFSSLFLLFAKHVKEICCYVGWGSACVVLSLPYWVP